MRVSKILAAAILVQAGPDFYRVKRLIIRFWGLIILFKAAVGQIKTFLIPERLARVGVLATPAISAGCCTADFYAVATMPFRSIRLELRLKGGPALRASRRSFRQSTPSC